MLKRFFTTAVVLVLGAMVAPVRPQAAAAGKDVTVLGFKLHYLEAGRGAPVVLLHGLGGDGSRWGPNGERGSLSEQEVRAVKAPTLVVWGKYDELANPAGADRLEKTIAGARKAIVDNCGHMPQLERADEFNRVVRDFLLTARTTTRSY